MMTQDKVVAFDSGCISAGNFAAASFVTKAKLPMFLCSILPRLPDEQKWAFSFLPPPKFEVDSRYEYLKNMTEIRKIGILGDPSPYGLLMRNIAMEDAKNFGLEIVANESYQQDDADFSIQVGRINAAGAIIMIGQGSAVITVANNIRQLGLNKMLLLGSINERELLVGRHAAHPGPSRSNGGLRGGRLPRSGLQGPFLSRHGACRPAGKAVSRHGRAAFLRDRIE
jgi:branched-chain amino acid transport system substrate-binding protein